MNKEFIHAIEELEKEHDISKEDMMKTLEAALVSACKKNYGDGAQNVEVNIDRETGDIEVFIIKEVVSDEEVTSESELTLDEARAIDPKYNLGDIVRIKTVPKKDFGRIAAQNAKQTVVQFIRETEKGSIYADFMDRKGEIMTGVVQRNNAGRIFVNIDKTEGILMEKEQVPGEDYSVHNRMKFYIMDVRDSGKGASRGPQVVLSRTHPGLVKKLFELEVPEIREGSVIIKNVAREAGSRTKISVAAGDPDVDAVGSCIGQRGVRVQAVVDELNGEKIDIISWSEDPSKLIMSALSPAKVEGVYIDEEEKSAIAVVPDYQLSLAIGRDGQNVRLAARLCGWKIDIKSETQFSEAGGNLYSEAEERPEEDDLSEEAYHEEADDVIIETGEVAEEAYNQSATEADSDGIVFTAYGDDD